MKLKFSGFDWLFLGIVILDLICLTFFPLARYVSKLLIVSLLLGWYIYTTGKDQHQLVMTALLFALLGDGFLLFDTPLTFQLGIGAFMIMQLCYAFYFSKKHEKPTEINMVLSLMAGGLALAFNIIFYNKLGAYKMPVMVYSIAITTMVYFGVNQTMHIQILYGAFLFMISDLVLAYQKFVNPIKELSYIVMITYALAQYFIIYGISKYQLSLRPKESTGKNKPRFEPR